MGPAATSSPEDWQTGLDQDGLPIASKSDRDWALFINLSHFVVLLLGIPIVVPLILWLIKKDQSYFIDDHGKEAVNFEISLLLWGIIAAVATLATCGVGFVLVFGVWVLGIVATVMGLVAASNGRYYRSPMCFRFIQ